MDETFNEVAIEIIRKDDEKKSIQVYASESGVLETCNNAKLIKVMHRTINPLGVSCRAIGLTG